MSYHYQRPSRLGRNVAAVLTALWVALTLLTGFPWSTSGVLIAMTIAGGRIGDMVADAHDEAAR